MSLLKVLAFNLPLTFIAAYEGRADPTVHLANGTLLGARDLAWSQDHFLGIPYAQPPTGDLRFSVPEPLNQTWPDPLPVKDYGSACVSYGVSTSSEPQTGISA